MDLIDLRLARARVSFLFIFALPATVFLRPKSRLLDKLRGESEYTHFRFDGGRELSRDMNTRTLLCRSPEELPSPRLRANTTTTITIATSTPVW